jgi:tetratricopeptide (TPR) repeat protein
MRSKEALVATERARECYALIGGASDQKLAILDLVIGGTLHELGRSDEGMARIRSARKTLCAYGDARQIYAAIMESWILFDLQQFREAQVVLHAAAVDAEANEDWESMARIHDHLGKVAIELGDLIGALTSLQKAAYLFERQG